MEKENKTLSFKLGATRWDVLEKERGDDDELGLTNPAKTEIYIFEKSQSSKQSEECKKNTLYHEVTHAILSTIGRNDLYQDEVFVQTLGTMFEQFEQTRTDKERLEKIKENISNFEDFLIGYESESNEGLLDQYRIEFENDIDWEKDDEFLKDESRKLVEIKSISKK